MEDIIVAMRPTAPQLPFGVPDSVRLLNPIFPPGAPLPSFDPLTGANITILNELFNFGWEYVWHCHLLGHEENDMMRPIVFDVARALPAAPVLSATELVTGGVDLLWSDGTPVASPTTLGNPANEIGFRIERAPAPAGAFVVIGQALANATTFTDPVGGAYQYRVIAFNAAGEVASNIVTVGNVPPVAPSNLLAAAQAGPMPQALVTFTDNANNEAGFTLQRATNATFTANLVSVALGANVTSYTDTTVGWQRAYFYRVQASNGFGVSAWSATANLPMPANPTGLVLSMNFNEANGVALDSSGNLNNGSLAQITRVAGQAGFGGALSFNGMGSVVNVPNSASLGLKAGMTLEAWVNPSALTGTGGATGWRTIILKERTTTGLSYALYGNDGNPNPSRPAGYVRIGTVDQQIAPNVASPLPLGTWTHVAVTYDGATLVLYVDGIVVTSRAQTGLIVSSTNPLRIGGNIVYPSEYFAGLIDDVRVYNRALSAAEIALDRLTPVP